MRMPGGCWRKGATIDIVRHNSYNLASSNFLKKSFVMKTSRFLLFLSLASIVSCSPKKDNPADSSQSASVGQDLPLERYLTFQLKPSEFFPINDWIKFSKDSPQLAGIFNLVGNHNDTYNYSFEINAQMKRRVLTAPSSYFTSKTRLFLSIKVV